MPLVVFGFYIYHVGAALGRKIVVAAWELAGFRQIILKGKKAVITVVQYTGCGVKQVTVRWIVQLSPPSKGLGRFLITPLNPPPDSWRTNLLIGHIFLACLLEFDTDAAPKLSRGFWWLTHWPVLSILLLMNAGLGHTPKQKHHMPWTLHSVCWGLHSYYSDGCTCHNATLFRFNFLKFTCKSYLVEKPIFINISCWIFKGNHWNLSVNNKSHRFNLTSLTCVVQNLLK